MIKQDLQHWFNTLSLDDRLQVQKFVLVYVLYRRYKMNDNNTSREILWEGKSKTLI